MFFDTITIRHSKGLSLKNIERSMKQNVDNNAHNPPKTTKSIAYAKGCVVDNFVDNYSILRLIRNLRNHEHIA